MKASDEPSDTHFFLTGTEEWLVLTFRGTLSLGNVATDLNILKSKEDHTEGSVHADLKMPSMPYGPHAFSRRS